MQEHAQITQTHWLIHHGKGRIKYKHTRKLDAVTGRQTIKDTLTDAACTSQFEVLPKVG